MRKLFIKLSLIIVPVALMVCLTNWRIDPANRFTGRQFTVGIAEILSKGHNVGNLSNYNERLLQEEMVKRLKSSPDIVVIGSSRIMEIGTPLFPGRSVLNCGVSHANMDDLLGVIGLLDSLGRLPKTLVIGVDPYLLGAGGTEEWKNLYAYREHLIRTLDPAGQLPDQQTGNYAIERLQSIFSLDYFKSSMEFILKHKSKQYRDVDSAEPGQGRYHDGTVSYPDSYKYPDSVKVAEDAKNTGLEQIVQPMDSIRAKRLEEVIHFLKAKGIAIKFIQIPFHPDFYASIRVHQPYVFQDFTRYYQNLGAKEAIPVTGSFDADSLEIPRSMFYDMYHCNKEAISKIINRPGTSWATN